METLKCKKVMLPTEKASPLVYNNVQEGLFCVGGKGILAKHRMGDCTNQHLYFISNREIKKGDCAMIININDPNYGYTVRISCESNLNIYAKVESSTDSDLHVPLIPQSFLEKFVEKQGAIDEILIEMFERFLYIDEDMKKITEWVPKVRKDNTVIVHPVKDSWNEQELYLNMQYYMEFCISKGYVTPKDWIEYHKHF